MRRRSQAAGLAAALAASCLVDGLARIRPADAANPSMATIRVHGAAVRGGSGIARGTAFRVSASELVTAAHTVAGCEAADVAGDGPSLAIRRAGAGADVAVLEVPPASVPALTLDVRHPPAGAEATHVGYAGAGVLVLRSRAIGRAWMVWDDGTASVVQVYALSPGSRPRHGMSGAPILVDGRVVAVHVAEQPRHGRILAVPIAAAEALLQERGLGRDSGRGLGRGAPAALEDRKPGGPGAVRAIGCRYER